MRLLVNKLDTQKWDEVHPDTLADWAKDGGKDVTKRYQDWLKSAKHGDVFVMGLNRILAVDLK